MASESRAASFIPVPCECGRTLRAKPDQVGSEIRCWDCHRMILVSMPRERQRVARELSAGFLGVIRGPGLNWILIAASVVTAALAVPRVGIGLAALVMAMGASAYGEVIRRVSRAEKDEEPPTWSAVLLPRTVPKAALCLLMAAGTVIPLWALNSGTHRSPHWSTPGAVIAGLAWFFLPIGMSVACGSDRRGRLGARKSLILLARHPFATLLALSIVPATLVLLEAGLGALLYFEGNLPFFALEFMPIPDKAQMVMYEGVPHYHSIDYRSYPQTRFIAAYFDGIRHGYSFTAGIPASLSLSTRAGLSPSILHHSYPIVYDGVRVFLTLVIVSGLLTGFAIQARWLGAIAAVEKKRPT